MITDHKILIGAGKLEGRQIPTRELAGIIHDAGFRGEEEVVMLAIILAESQGYEKACHEYLDDADELVGVEMGLGQIRVPVGQIPENRDLYDAEFNVDVCFKIWVDQGFRYWQSYARGIATDPERGYIQKAIEGVANYWAWKWGIEQTPFLVPAMPVKEQWTDAPLEYEDPPPDLEPEEKPTRPHRGGPGLIT